jgi:hypothetical protein
VALAQLEEDSFSEQNLRSIRICVPSEDEIAILGAFDGDRCVFFVGFCGVFEVFLTLFGGFLTLFWWF